MTTKEMTAEEHAHDSAVPVVNKHAYCHSAGAFRGSNVPTDPHHGDTHTNSHPSSHTHSHADPHSDPGAATGAR
jgi:hypothetical protein